VVACKQPSGRRQGRPPAADVLEHVEQRVSLSDRLPFQQGYGSLLQCLANVLLLQVMLELLLCLASQ
jgi:hypothetical protein